MSFRRSKENLSITEVDTDEPIAQEKEKDVDKEKLKSEILSMLKDDEDEGVSVTLRKSYSASAASSSARGSFTETNVNECPSMQHSFKLFGGNGVYCTKCGMIKTEGREILKEENEKLRRELKHVQEKLEKVKEKSKDAARFERAQKKAEEEIRQLRRQHSESSSMTLRHTNTVEKLKIEIKGLKEQLEDEKAARMEMTIERAKLQRADKEAWEKVQKLEKELRETKQLLQEEEEAHNNLRLKVKLMMRDDDDQDDPVN